MVRVWSFVYSWAEVERRRAEASALLGDQLVGVTYYEIDYERQKLRPEVEGIHQVENASEWIDPNWATAQCDSLDYGLELATASGRVFSVTWDPPGQREGIGIQQEPLVGSALRPSADAASWDVGQRSRWAPLLNAPIQEAALRYIPWDPGAGSYWCTRITLNIAGSTVVMMLGEAAPDGQINPSADTIAILFDPPQLPSWERRRLGAS